MVRVKSVIDPDSECTLFQFLVIAVCGLIYEFVRLRVPADVVYVAFLCLLFRESAYILPWELTSVALL